VIEPVCHEVVRFGAWIRRRFGKRSERGTGSGITRRGPAENYNFKPTPEIQDFGTRVAHIVSANLRTCASLKGEQKAVSLNAASSRAEIAAAMKEAWD
jgi:hypothetical protein